MFSWNNLSKLVLSVHTKFHAYTFLGTTVRVLVVGGGSIFSSHITALSCDTPSVR